MAAACLTATLAMAAGNGAPGELIEVRVRLSSDTGCWFYFGDATIFTGKFKKGAYIGVSMVTIGRDGFPEAPDQEERSPVLDAPELSGGPANRHWFGPLAASKDYQIMFSPRASFGSTALVTVCGRTSLEN
ncbi:hypothetical protein NKH48_23250 [Mesorhizobium sp. M1233]|uniref:hypothetical protein n=1 Tax=Mesorhizobium sp. M1233 TaxID=2957072 RepID=UPI00333B2F82